MADMAKMLRTMQEKIDASLANFANATVGRKRPRNTDNDGPGNISNSEPSDHEQDEDHRDKKSRTYEVSELTKAFLQTAFCLPKPVDNATRRTWINKFGVPEGVETRCPKLDGLIKGELPKEATEADRKLSRLQNFTLDIAGPLVAALEELTANDKPDATKVTAAIQMSLRFLGNALAQYAQERRTRAMTHLNPDLKSLVEDEDFSQSLPLLFGAGFEKKAKERIKALDCLRKATSTGSEDKKSSNPTQAAKKPFRYTRYRRQGDYGGGNYPNHRYHSGSYQQPRSGPGGRKNFQNQNQNQK
jgi:hypothetical protein